jgi:hypothetical protein
MDDPTSLLGSVTIDPETIGWDVIDRETWNRLARLMTLPAEARHDLVSIVRSGQSSYYWAKRQGRESPTRSRKKLDRLHKLAQDLAEGLKEMGSSAGTAVWRSLEDAQQPPMSLLGFANTNPIESFVADAERLRDHLARAIEIASGWHGITGRDRTLRKLVEALHLFLIFHTGKGLVRSSAATKTRIGRAAACREFVSQVMFHIFEEEIKSSTLDDAIKDVIRRHRFVGDS